MGCTWSKSGRGAGETAVDVESINMLHGGVEAAPAPAHAPAPAPASVVAWPAVTKARRSIIDITLRRSSEEKLKRARRSSSDISVESIDSSDGAVPQLFAALSPAMKDSLDMSNFDAHEQRPVAPPPESDDAQADDELFSDWVYADTS